MQATNQTPTFTNPGNYKINPASELKEPLALGEGRYKYWITHIEVIDFSGRIRYGWHWDSHPALRYAVVSAHHTAASCGIYDDSERYITDRIYDAIGAALAQV